MDLLAGYGSNDESDARDKISKLKPFHTAKIQLFFIIVNCLRTGSWKIRIFAISPFSNTTLSPQT